MSKYRVEVARLSHPKFGVLTKGCKFTAKDSEVEELLKSKQVKLLKVDVEVHESLSEEELLEKGVSQEDIDAAVSQGEEVDEPVEVKPKRKKGKK